MRKRRMASKMKGSNRLEVGDMYHTNGIRIRLKSIIPIFC